MMRQTSHQQFYIDLRPATSTAQLSLDLSRHLACRLAVGKVVIVADKPRIFCSVLCKRWQRVINEIKLQHNLTFDRVKKRQLAHELAHWQEIHISSKSNTDAHVMIISPSQSSALPRRYATLYITSPAGNCLAQLLTNLMPGGLVVVYQHCWEEFCKVMQIEAKTTAPH